MPQLIRLSLLSGNSYNSCTDPSCAASAGAADGTCVHDDARADAGRLALLERDVMLALARQLRVHHSVVVPVVSIGATPASSSGVMLATAADGGAEGASARGASPQVELHPGNYIFYDRQQVESGSCILADVACYVVARVVARYL